MRLLKMKKLGTIHAKTATTARKKATRELPKKYVVTKVKSTKRAFKNSTVFKIYGKNRKKKMM